MAAGALAVELVGVVDDQVVAVGLAGEVAVDDLGLEEAFGRRRGPGAVEDGAGRFFDRAFEFVARRVALFEAPLAAEEGDVLMKGKMCRGRCP